MVARLWAACGAALLVTGCAAGGGSQSAPHTANASAHVNVTLSIERSVATSGRTVRFVSPAAQSVTVTVAPQGGGGGGTLVANIGPNAPDCRTVSNVETCQLGVQAPVGNDVFTVVSFAGPLGTGSRLSAGSTTMTVIAGQDNVASVGLAAFVGALALSAPGTVTAGAAGTAALTVTAQDPSGATITGDYGVPVTFLSDDTSGHTSVSPASLTSSSQAATLSFDAAVSGTVHVTAVVGPVHSNSVAIVLVNANPQPIVASPSTVLIGSPSPQPIALSEAGYLGGFTATPACSSAGTTIAMVSGSGTQFSIAPASSGSCTATFSDTNGQILAVPVTVTQSAITITIP